MTRPSHRMPMETYVRRLAALTPIIMVMALTPAGADPVADVLAQADLQLEDLCQIPKFEDGMSGDTTWQFELLCVALTKVPPAYPCLVVPLPEYAGEDDWGVGIPTAGGVYFALS